MSYYIWLTVNIIFIVASAIYIWLFRSHTSTIITVGQLFAQVGIILFLININMYFIFRVIRRSKVRKLKIYLAKMSRKMMKAHIPIATLGTVMIVFHSCIMLLQVGEIIGYTHSKLVSGYGAILFLCMTLFAGYLRHKKATGFRRKFHLSSAVFFAVVFTIHLFLPI